MSKKKLNQRKILCRQIWQKLYGRQPVLDLSVDRYTAWRAWKAKWINYCIVTELEKKAPEYLSTMLRVNDIYRYESLNLSETDAKDTAKITDVLQKLPKE